MTITAAQHSMAGTISNAKQKHHRNHPYKVKSETERRQQEIWTAYILNY